MTGRRRVPRRRATTPTSRVSSPSSACPASSTSTCTSCPSVLRKVWGYFDQAEEHYGTPWPVHYRSRSRSGSRRWRARRADVRAAGLPAQARAWRAGSPGGSPPSPRDAGRGADGHALPGAGRRRLPRCRGRGRGAHREGARAGRRVRPARSAAPPGLGAARRGRGPGRRALRPRPDRAARTPGSTCSARCWPSTRGCRWCWPTRACPTSPARSTSWPASSTSGSTRRWSARRSAGRFAPLPSDWPARLVDVADRVVFGSDFPNIPYAYAEQVRAVARGRPPTTGSAPRSCARCCTTLQPDCSVVDRCQRRCPSYSRRVDTWLVVAVVVAVVVIALLAVLARRRGRSQRPPAPPGRAPELGAVGEPPVSAEPDPIGRGGGVDAPDSAEAPTSPVGAPTLAGSSNPAPADQTMRLPVRGPRPDQAGQVDPTDVLPVVRRPRRDPSLPDGAEPNRHARPDGQPPPEPPNGGGGRHRADAEQSGPWEPNRSADVQRTEPRGAAVVPNPAGAEPPLPPPPAGAEPPLPARRPRPVLSHPLRGLLARSPLRHLRLGRTGTPAPCRYAAGPGTRRRSHRSRSRLRHPDSPVGRR